MSQIINGYEFPAGWTVLGEIDDWTVLRDGVQMIAGTVPAIIYASIDFDDESIPEEFLFQECDFYAAIFPYRPDQPDPNWDAWLAECPSKTRNQLGTSGSLAYLIASYIGDMK